MKQFTKGERVRYVGTLVTWLAGCVGTVTNPQTRNGWVKVDFAGVECKIAEHNLQRAEAEPGDAPRVFAHLPARCPSMHYNGGDDICEDCGTDLNPPQDSAMIDIRFPGDAPGVFRMHRASEPLPAGATLYNQLLHGRHEDETCWQRAARAAGITRGRDINGEMSFWKHLSPDFYITNKEHVDIAWREAARFYGVESAVDEPEKPLPGDVVMPAMVFSLYEIRRVIEQMSPHELPTCTSFLDDAEFEEHAAYLRTRGVSFKEFWTLYGRRAGEEGQAEAIGDFTSKETAQATLNAILAVPRAALWAIQREDYAAAERWLKELTA